MNTAENGGNGRSCHMRGKNGEHLSVKVPVGTCVSNLNGDLLIDFDKHGQKFYAAQ
jgi:GTPase involved in cell partitioning and DNA repair